MIDTTKEKRRVRTMLHATNNWGDCDYTLKFAEVRHLNEPMKKACAAAVRCSLPNQAFLVDFGPDLGRVRVSTKQIFTGAVSEALSLIAYRDVEFDALFFLYRDKSGSLCATLGNSRDIAQALDAWLETDRFAIWSYDPQTMRCQDSFYVPDLPTLFCIAEGDCAGAEIDLGVVTVSHDYVSMDLSREPVPIRTRMLRSLVNAI